MSNCRTVVGAVWFLVSVGWFPAVPGQAAEPAPNPVAAQLDQANLRLAAKEYAAARAEYAKIVESADAPAHCKSLAQLQMAASFVRQQDWSAAKAEYERLQSMPGVPAHHRGEARECLREMERLRAGLPPRDPAWSRVQLPKRPAPGAELFVAPDGKDADPGSRERPLATLEGARNTIRELKRSGKLPRGGVTVYLRGGEYPRRETFRLSAEDSGTADSPIVYRAAPGETARLNAGVRLTGFKPVRDPAVLARLPEESRGKVLQADLKSQGIAGFGNLRRRGFGGGDAPVLELFFNGNPMTLARWPNEGFVRVGKVIDAGGSGPGGAVFEYEGDRPARWTKAPDPWLFGYWRYYWADARLAVASVDPQSRRIRLAEPYTYGGGIAAGMPYHAFNLLEEIDVPGEWYLDRSAGVLYFYPPSDPAAATVCISMLSSPLVVMQEVSHVTLQGLVLELGRTSGIVVNGGDHCLIAGCTVRRLGGDGVVIDGGANHGILSCDIHTLGRGGTRVQGGDRRTLTPSGHFVENCHIYDFSRIDRTYTPAIWTDGVGTRIAHNLYHDSPGHGMRLEGNDHLVEFNEVYNVVWESDDQGGMEMFGNPTYRGVVFRHNFYHDIANRFDRPCGEAGIRLDDAICGALIYGNVFFRCSSALFGGVQIHGGKENIVDNNVFVDCKYAISFSGWGKERWAAFLASPPLVRQLTKEIDISQPPYSTRYPALAHLADNPDANAIWRNVVSGCGQFLTRDRGIQDLVSNHVAKEDVGFVDAKRLNFQLKPDAAVIDRTGLRPIPFDEIGLYQDEFRASRPVQRSIP